MDSDIQVLSESALETLRNLISIPSLSRQEKEAADYLELRMNQKGLETGRKGNNVWSLGAGWSTRKPTILLNSHLDTVKPVASWKRDPFQPNLEGDRLYGLGSNDAGASLVTLLEVFQELTQTSQPYNLLFLATSEEEISGSQGMEMARKILPHADLALVGEPTGCQPAIAEKGLMVLDVISRGKSGHAARQEGINAIHGILEDLIWLRDYRFEKVSPLLGEVRMSVTVIQAGSQHNVVPDTCSCLVDVRSNECYRNEELFEIIQSHLRSQVSAHSFRLGSSSLSLEHPLARKAVAMGLKPFGSPTLSDQALLRCPSMKIGPGESSRSHTADEYIRLGEIEQGIRTYLSLLDGLEIPFSPERGQ